MQSPQVGGTVLKRGAMALLLSCIGMGACFHRQPPAVSPPPSQQPQGQAVPIEENDLRKRHRAEVSNFADRATMRFQQEGVALSEVQELEKLKLRYGKVQMGNVFATGIVAVRTDVFADKKFLRLTNSMTAKANSHNVVSEVRLETEISGATIKYQTIGSRSSRETPTTAKQPTTCSEIMPIGFYHIWTERGARSRPTRTQDTTSSTQRRP